MKSIAARFSLEMKRIISFVDLIVATYDLGKQQTARFYSKHALAMSARTVHSQIRLLPRGDSLAFEGVFLTSCALFEECVRDLIEETATQAAARKYLFTELPKAMQDNHLDGCIDMLRSRKLKKFAGLPPETVIGSMATCHTSVPSPGYKLTLEAFSSHTSNFSSDVLKESIKKVGLVDLWTKLGNEACLRAIFPSATPSDTDKFSRARLDGIMTQRNNTIHRATGFTAPTDIEVKQYAEFLDALVSALANILVSYVATL